MSDIARWEGWLCENCGTTTTDEPVRCRCELWLGPGYSNSIVLVPADRLAGAVKALRDIKIQLSRIASATEREDGAARALVIALDALDDAGGR